MNYRAPQSAIGLLAMQENGAIGDQTFILDNLLCLGPPNPWRRFPLRKQVERFLLKTFIVTIS